MDEIRRAPSSAGVDLDLSSPQARQAVLGGPGTVPSLLGSTDNPNGGSSAHREGSDGAIGTVIHVQFRDETEADRMVGDRGDYFRTDAMQDEFRRRMNVATSRLLR